MFREIFAHALFELTIRRKSLSSYIYFLMFGTLAFFIALAAGGAFDGVVMSFGASSKVLINAPLSIARYTNILTMFLLFIIAAVFGRSICKDYINQMDEIMFSSRLKVKRLLVGRFLGAMIFLFFIYLSIPLGIFIASALPFVLESTLGPQRLSGYMVPMFTIALPNIFILGAFFFLVGSKTKKMTAIYVIATIMFLLFRVSGQLSEDLENKLLTTLIDPTGVSAAEETFRYWTVAQQNTEHLFFESYFLWNRLFWLSLAAAAFFVSVFTFSKSAKPGKNKDGTEVGVSSKTKTSNMTFQPIDFSEVSWIPALITQVKFEFKQSVKSIYFLVITLAGVGFMFASSTRVGEMFGTNTYPVTYYILEMVVGVFSLFVLIIITIYTGEAIWRDRDRKVDQIIDASPAPNFVFFAAKYLNIVLIVVVLLSAMMASGLIIQVAYGYTNFEIGQYLKGLYLIQLPMYLNVISLTFFLQVISRNKYLAHALVIVYYLFTSFASSMGFEHRLYQFNSSPTTTYSDMNGYGHLFKVFHIFNTYWLFLSLLIMVFTYIFWHRGTLLPSYREALHIIKAKASKPLIIVTAVALLGFGTFGAYLFNQTNVINEFLSTADTEQRAFDYERQYKMFEKVPQIELNSVSTNVDLYPSELKVKISADLGFVNHNESPIKQIFINVPKGEWELSFSKSTTNKYNKELRVVIYDLDEPILPGEKISAKYSIEIDKSSIENGSNIGKIHHNGTFFDNGDYYPRIGYSRGLEISSSKTREKYGLKPKLRAPAIDDSHHHQHNALGTNASWIDFEAIVSTSGDQIAIAPGYLQKKWSEKGRNYFKYKMDKKILNFYSFLSGRYEVIRDRWNHVGIEIYYHKGHEYNLDRLVNSTKKSLDYFTQNFGPYQHNQYRIIEFPRYRQFAQSFPNTIPFSEGIGFIAKVDDQVESDIDYAFYVNAHELAHQWWGHQLVGADVQGSYVLAESFSQYSALMVMEKEYGKEKMKKFLKYELDKYLRGRARESEFENPLYLTEGQGYIHYNKGSLVFYALRDYVGEDVVNAAFKETLERFGGRRTSYMTMKDFLKVLKRKTPEKYQGIVEDMFEKIVLFQIRPTEVKSKLISNDDYEVTLKLSATKLYSDKEGNETEADFAQEIDIGVLDENGKYLYLKKHLISKGDQEITVRVSGKPDKAGIDPLNILIDRNPDDNVIAVEFVNQKAI